MLFFHGLLLADMASRRRVWNLNICPIMLEIIFIEKDYYSVFQFVATFFSYAVTQKQVWQCVEGLGTPTAFLGSTSTLGSSKGWASSNWCKKHCSLDKGLNCPPNNTSMHVELLQSFLFSWAYTLCACTKPPKEIFPLCVNGINLPFVPRSLVEFTWKEHFVLMTLAVIVTSWH